MAVTQEEIAAAYEACVVGAQQPTAGTTSGAFLNRFLVTDIYDPDGWYLVICDEPGAKIVPLGEA